MLVLIAEDDPVSRRVLEAHLTKWGYDVLVTRDGTEAWQALQQKPSPQLAILDWMMPEMDGTEVVRKLRQCSGLPYAYVLLLTAKGQREDIVAGLEAGADDYLTKPFDAHELQARIRTGRRILEMQDELIAAWKALREKATHDHLTGVWNRAEILEILQRECARSARTARPVAVVLADLDHFKRINDTYGHLAGDDVLREVSRRMGGAIRAYDSIGRYGGEEFVIVLPDCDAPNALQQAERLRCEVSSRPVATSGMELTSTVSLGVAASDPPGCEDYKILLRMADEALYQAKTSGRNRTIPCQAVQP